MQSTIIYILYKFPQNIFGSKYTWEYLASLPHSFKLRLGSKFMNQHIMFAYNPIPTEICCISYSDQCSLYKNHQHQTPYTIKPIIDNLFLHLACSVDMDIFRFLQTYWFSDLQIIVPFTPKITARGSENEDVFRFLERGISKQQIRKLESAFIAFRYIRIKGFPFSRIGIPISCMKTYKHYTWSLIPGQVRGAGRTPNIALPLSKIPKFRFKLPSG